MRICRFTTFGSATPRIGLVDDDSMFCRWQKANKLSRFLLHDVEAIAISDDVRFLAPVAPSKIVCVGRNYREHAAELGNKMPDEPIALSQSHLRR